MKLSDSNFLLLDGKDTGTSPKRFAQKLGRRNEKIPIIYFTMLDAGDITPTLDLNQNAIEKNWVAFEK